MKPERGKRRESMRQTEPACLSRERAGVTQQGSISRWLLAPPPLHKSSTHIPTHCSLTAELHCLTTEAPLLNPACSLRAPHCVQVVSGSSDL